MSNFEVSGGFGVFLAAVTMIFGLFVSIFWMWIGWRAMLAHERIAAALQDTGRSETQAGSESR